MSIFTIRNISFLHTICLWQMYILGKIYTSSAHLKLIVESRFNTVTNDFFLNADISKNSMSLLLFITSSNVICDTGNKRSFYLLLQSFILMFNKKTDCFFSVIFSDDKISKTKIS